MTKVPCTVCSLKLNGSSFLIFNSLLCPNTHYLSVFAKRSVSANSGSTIARTAASAILHLQRRHSQSSSLVGITQSSVGWRQKGQRTVFTWLPSSLGSRQRAHVQLKYLNSSKNKEKKKNDNGCLPFLSLSQSFFSLCGR